MSISAVQVDFLLGGLEDSTGVPLSGGKVYTYEPGTTTPKITWLDNAKAAAASNPIILDTRGKALVFADGVYKFVIKDSQDNTIYTWDGLEYEPAPPSSSFKGAVVYRIATYSVNDSTFDEIPWTHELYDTDAFHDNGTNPERITIPSGVSKVKLKAHVWFAPDVDGYRRITFSKNGSYSNLVGMSADIVNDTGASYTPLMIESGVINVSQGDYFEVTVYHTAGAAINVAYAYGTFSFFSIEVVE